eukprot:319010-Chlamydomonas_euryale.AAC.5
MSACLSQLKEVATNPAAELCWYFPESREQYRISGDLHIVTAGEKDNNMLQHNLKEKSRRLLFDQAPCHPNCCVNVRCGALTALLVDTN